MNLALHSATVTRLGSVPRVSRFYVTTPIYYVNAEPHLGHAYTTIVGDALTRWHRLLGDDVKFLTGTDEHGLKIQQAAEAAGTSPQEFADGIAPKFVEAWRRLEIANDDFIRTTEPRHKRAVVELLQRCYDAGDIELDLYSGKYCVSCEEYYTDDELIDGELCPIHKRPVDHFEEENYFFRLSRFQDRLLDWYAAHPGAIVPEFRGNEALGLIRGGLRDFSVSRTSLKWGIPLPWDPGHVAYVWFDALTNYLAAVGFGDDSVDYTEWWPVDYHLIGKDIIRHHCVYWPAMLMSAGVELPKGWAVGGFLLTDGEKMSKTTGNVMSPLDLIDTVGVDGFRYYVLAETPYGQDGDFTVDGLIGRYNSDLANNLGNLVSRVATVVEKKCGGIGPAPNPDSPLAEAAQAAYAATHAAWDVVAPSRALEATWQLIRATNAHLEANEPWRADPGPAVDAVMGDALEALRIVAVLSFPAIPATAQVVWERIGFEGDIADPTAAGGRRVGSVPGRPSRHQGPTAVPPHRDTDRDDMTWVDSHCHVHDERIPDGTAGAVAAAQRVRRREDDHGRVRPGHVARRRSPPRPPTPACSPRSGSTRTRPSAGVDSIADLLDTPGIVAVGEAGLDYYYDHAPRDGAAGRVRRPDPARARPRAAARDPQPRRVDRHVRHPRRRGRARPARSSTASPAAPTRSGAASISGRSSASRAS